MIINSLILDKSAIKIGVKKIEYIYLLVVLFVHGGEKLLEKEKRLQQDMGVAYEDKLEYICKQLELESNMFINPVNETRKYMNKQKYSKNELLVIRAQLESSDYVSNTALLLSGFSFLLSIMNIAHFFIIEIILAVISCGMLMYLYYWLVKYRNVNKWRKYIKIVLEEMLKSFPD